jgi:non-ribosomal peptide synthetase-like protein
MSSAKTRASTASTVLEIFDRVAERAPDSIALDIPTIAAWSYAELDRSAARVADLVRDRLENRTARDAVVAIALSRRDPWLFASLLGVMRAGAAYVAIDPVFPARQAASILEDAGAIALIADDVRAEEILAHSTDPSRISHLSPAALAARELEAHTRANDNSSNAVPMPPAADALAYVIYTSGTTGKPKGVEIEHGSLFNLVDGDRREFALGPNDRVAQGSSASYDSSVEEMWLAWAAGGTVVVMDDETARLGPDLVPWLIEQRITVLCPPPTLLRTLACEDPRRTLPEIRLLYVGGEALPPDIADLWSRGRRLENGYGPTECTVTCLRSTVHSGEEVTIGRAIPGSFAAIIDPDDSALRVIEDDARGEPVLGELVVGGASLARGYRGQPDVTRARFVEHPQLGRVYRTGDLVHRDLRGEFHYHGRIDAQVKLRGYRVELGAIEAKLAAHPSVLEAAATVEDANTPRARLVAHVVACTGATIDVAQLRDALAAELPSYMVPTTIATIDAIPRSVGGKLDRKRLPRIIDASHEIRERDFVAPTTATERAVASALAIALGRGSRSPVRVAPSDADQFVSIDDDIFDDLGLDSLTIAIAISHLRADERTRAATVRIAYEHRTARAIAHAVDNVRERGDSRFVGNNQTNASRTNTGATPDAARAHVRGTSRPITFTLAQGAFLTVLVVALAQFLWIPTIGDQLENAWVDGGIATVAVALIAGLSLVAYTGLAIAVGIAAKWLLIGRYTPMRARAFSGWHLRHWIVVRLVSLAPWEMLEAVGLAPLALRLLGARIGRNVHIHRGVRLTEGGWDLITLEDDATIGQDACLRAVELEAGTIVVGPVTVRRGATLETRAGLSPGAELGEGSILRALSNLSPGLVESHALLDGIPAEKLANAPAPPAVTPAPAPVVRVIIGLTLFAIIVSVLVAPWTLAALLFGLLPDQAASTTSVYAHLYGTSDALIPTVAGLARIVGATIFAGIGTVLLQALLVRVLGKPPRGPYALGSIASLRMSLQSMLVEGAGRWLSGTIMWPMWLNLAGARIGRGCEISTVTDVVPSTVEIGRETFFADGIYLGGPRLHAGTATIEPVTLESSCFVGNHAVLPSGTRLARETLVGISTRGDGLPDEVGASWFGHPIFRLPRREIVEMSRELTHEPPLVRRVNRWMWELARFALPIGPVFLALVMYRVLEVAERTASAWTFRFMWLPCALLAAFAALAASVLLLKWALIGRVKPGTHALWSCWCSRWDFLYVMWGMWASKPLALLEGTLLLVAYLRLMGCRIGKRALLGSGFSHVVDPDMLHFGDDVTVQALFQAHTFEDRVLKVDHVFIEDRATVGANTVLLYGARVGRGAIVEPHSVVMKREVLVSETRYEGVPTQPIGPVFMHVAATTTTTRDAV